MIRKGRWAVFRSSYEFVLYTLCMGLCTGLHVGCTGWYWGCTETYTTCTASHLWIVKVEKKCFLCWPFAGEDVVYLWDLRFITRGPVRKYPSVDGWVETLVREPRHGTLLAGGQGGITCSDFNTGITRLSLFSG